MSETFYDRERRAWDVSVTIGAARTIFKRVQIDLQNPLHLSRLMGDTEGLYLTGELLAILCGPMVAATWPDCRTPDEIQAKVDAVLEDHGVWKAAYRALCDSIADFCRRHGRPAIAEHVANLPSVWAAMEEATQIRTPTPTEPLGTGSGAWPEKSASPTPTA